MGDADDYIRALAETISGRGIDPETLMSVEYGWPRMTFRMPDGSLVTPSSLGQEAATVVAGGRMDGALASDGSYRSFFLRG